MNDSISRLAAIKTIDEMLQLLPYDPLKSDYTQGITIGLSLAESRIKRLPPAQPETCEGCKHLSKWENEVEYGYSSPCTRCKRRVEDYYER